MIGELRRRGACAEDHAEAAVVEARRARGDLVAREQGPRLGDAGGPRDGHGVERIGHHGRLGAVAAIVDPEPATACDAADQHAALGGELRALRAVRGQVELELRVFPMLRNGRWELDLHGRLAVDAERDDLGGGLIAGVQRLDGAGPDRAGVALCVP